MADQNSSLPVRTEANGDVVVKLGDGTTPSQQLAVDSSGRAVVKLDDGSGNVISSQASGGQRALDVGVNVAGVQVDPRAVRALTSSDVVTVVQPTPANFTATVNIAAAQTLSTVTTVSTVTAVTAITNALPTGTNRIGTARLDVGGADVSATNPVPVTLTANVSGTPVQSYNTAAAVAAAATSNHDYTVTAAKTLSLTRIWGSSSGKLKIEVQVETGVATGVFNTKFVGFNSTSSPNIDITNSTPTQVAAGVRVRVIRTNEDKAAEDVYTTVEGSES